MAQATEKQGKPHAEGLTEARIKAEPPPAKGKRIIYDTHRDAPRGFAVRIMPTGSRTFALRYSAEGRDRILTIGEFPTWSLKAARIEAAKLRQAVDSGTDPLQVERDRKAAEKAAQAAAQAAEEDRARYTLAKLAEAYCAHLEAQGKAKSARDARSSFRVNLTGVPELATIAATPAKEIEPAQIALIVRRVAEAGKSRAAGVLRSYLAAAFNAARRAPFSATLPAALIPFGVTTNPVEPVPPIPVRAGTRTLTPAELRAYMLALSDSPQDQALRLALFAGGQRLAQLVRVTVADFDPEAATLLLFDPKGRRRTARPHLIPLAPMGAQIARQFAETAAPGGPLLTGATHPDTLSKRVAEVSRKIGGEPFDARALRRTVETLMVGACGVSKDVRAQLLSHGLSGVQAVHYDKHDYLSEKRAALAKWEAYLSRLTGAPATVTKIAAKA